MDRWPDAVTATSRRVRGAIGGERGDLEWIVARLTPPLIEQARYRLRGRLQHACDAEDVVNHAWLVCLPRLPELVARDGRYTPVLLKFLSTAILNRVNDLLRREIRTRTKSDQDRGEAEGSAGSCEPAVEAPAPWKEVVRREARGRVVEALRQLGDADREVLLLRLVEQMPAAAAGAKIGIEANAVNVRLHRALARLRAHLDASVFDDFAEEAGAEG
jgi:RNA polymerase sigma-70 factor (ECF subfamily)